MIGLFVASIFQSTLPYGSDFKIFKPRNGMIAFQSTLPYGSDVWYDIYKHSKAISIHAPLRERLRASSLLVSMIADFNPRSLTGATFFLPAQLLPRGISIHAPLRERLATVAAWRAAELISIHAPLRERRKAEVLIILIANFNPRSLTGATSRLYLPVRNMSIFQSTLPYGSDSIKTKYFSIHLNQAFIANRLNSNPQRFYFDVRKLLVSHSSSSCEPKLILCSI